MVKSKLPDAYAYNYDCLRALDMAMWSAGKSHYQEQ